MSFFCLTCEEVHKMYCSFRSKLCIPYLKKSSHAHILTLSPPLDMKPYWFAPHVAYTISKFGMSMCVLGFHEELRPYNIAVNALWPKTGIHWFWVWYH